MSAVMQIARVLSDKMKSLSVIRMFSEYSFGISIQFQPVSLSHFSELLYHQIFGVGKSYPHSSEKNIFIDVAVDGAESKLSGGISSGRSLAVNQIVDFLSSHVSLLTGRVAGCFAPLFCQSQGYANIPIPSGLCFPLFISRFVPGLLLVPEGRSLLSRKARCR